jgi:hypothetical protein
LASCDPAQQHNLQLELGAIKAAAASSTARGRSGSQAAGWRIWDTFCRDLACDPFLADIEDPVPLLQIFASRYRVGTLAPSGAQVKARTVEDALRSVGQTLASLGHSDPRLQHSGRLDFRLQRQLQGYNKQDPPPLCVKPIPLQIILHVVNDCYITEEPALNAMGHRITLGFFFLLRPGEYALTDNPEASPFRICDVHLLHHNTRLDHNTCPEHALHTATHVALEFTTQKNGVRGELVGLGRSGHAVLCPVNAMIARLKHFRLHRAPPTTCLYTYYTNNSTASINTTTLTQRLRTACTTLGPTVGITPQDISIRSLRSSGAMALLCADVDPDRIRLLGRWRSDEMLRYLHVQALPIVAPLSTLMVQHGFFSFIPNNRLG